MAREQGFEDSIRKDFPGIQIRDKRYGWADRAKSLAIAENMLTAYSDLDAMFVDSGQACHHHSRGLPGGSAPFTTQGTSAAATASLMVKHAGRPAPATQ